MKLDLLKHIKCRIFNKSILLIFITIFVSSFLFSQTSSDNLKKYWFYRTRLITDFLKVGKNQGESIPASLRGKGFLIDNPSESYIPILDWGDATSDLGYYIAVLATEYKLLKDNSQDVSATARELYYAIEAFNRLDLNAESYWRNPGQTPSPQSGDLNGFFIVDDVPASINDDGHFNSGLANSNIIVSEITSSYTEKLSDGNAPKAATHDQYWNLMMGFALISELIGEWDTYNSQPFADGEYYFAKEARNIVDRMIKYMKGNRWAIANPVNDFCENWLSNGNGSDWPCLPGGAYNASELSFPAAEAACKIVNGSQFSHLHITSCFTYHDDITLNASQMWITMVPQILSCPQSSALCVGNVGCITDLTCNQCQEMYKVVILAALSSSYYAPNPLLPGTWMNITSEILSIQSKNMQFEIFPLLHQALYGGGNPDISNNFYIDLMNDAPCGGPYNFGNGHYMDYDWSAPNKFRQPERLGLNGSDACGDLFSGEYSGLDYMLLFNLYCIENDDYLSDVDISYVNYMEFDVSLNMPHTFSIQENFIVGAEEINPFGIVRDAEFNAFNKITSTQQIKMSDQYGRTKDIMDFPIKGHVTYRAGSEIDLKPGFTVEGGAYFDASIGAFNCNLNKSTNTTPVCFSDFVINSYDSLISKYEYAPLAENYPTTEDMYKSSKIEPPKKDTVTFNNYNIFSIAAYPNPFNNTTTIEYNIPYTSDVNISIFDIYGTKIMQPINQYLEKGEHSNTVNMSHISKGIYYCKLKSGNQSKTIKLVLSN